jgi:competence protein CoiA
MLYAVTPTGADAEPTPGATGTCPLCGGAVLAKCGQINVWHWAHRAGQDCDPWTEPLTDWHRAYQRVVPAERCEVVIGKHRADVVAPAGHVLELQHSTISVEDIAKREAHYGSSMVWLFDARQPFEARRLIIRRGDTDDYVTFRWKQPRRSIAACDRTVLLDLGEGLVLRIKKLYPRRPFRGWGHVFHTVDIWTWLRDGTLPTPIPWTGDEHRDLVNRIIRSATYLRSAPSSPAGDGETARIMKAMLYAGDTPTDQIRAALTTAQDQVDLTDLQDHIGLTARWRSPGQLSVLCWCGRSHHFNHGPTNREEFDQWRHTRTWPETLNARCHQQPGRISTVRIPAPPPSELWDGWGF